ncbi:hypothetical protein JNUCC0626_31360 [Lentzea sp. JNUCC 0626]|uniref:hypothetical protein n=1 Tax=Lentzea sp. JNUCC 0626 TaxID=3367513 RepID=UPI00374A76E7
MISFRLVAAVLGTAALTACSTPPPPAAPVQQAAPTTTTTANVPGADPAAWFDAYCGPLGVLAIARRDIPAKAAQGPQEMKTALLSWVKLAATSDRLMADTLEKLGPLGSDVQNPHERLVKSLRGEAKGFDDAAVRLDALAADEKFPERYEQVMATGFMGEDENVKAFFKQILDVPAYNSAFRANKVCSDWQATARGN